MTNDIYFDETLNPKAFDASFKSQPLAGVDEAGRGPLAGPVVAAAVILNPDQDYPGLGDSKKLSPAAREKAFDLIAAGAMAWAWAAVAAEEVDRINPLAAAMLAMGQSLAQLTLKPALVLVDGNQKPPYPGPLKTVVKGDAKSLAIGAASIMAKVIRDRLMLDLHQLYPQYGFDRHKGYGTAEHLEALKIHGPSPYHRLTFRGVLPAKPTPHQVGLDFGGDHG